MLSSSRYRRAFIKQMHVLTKVWTCFGRVWPTFALVEVCLFGFDGVGGDVLNAPTAYGTRHGDWR